VAELIEHARANPGKLNYAAANATAMLGPALLASQASLEMHPVPYKGEALAMNDLLSGRLQLMFISGTLISHVKEGRLRALFTVLGERSPLLPEVPTMTEAGLPAFPNQRGASPPRGPRPARQPGVRRRRLDARGDGADHPPAARSLAPPCPRPAT